jgi:hypothetical protein
MADDNIDKLNKSAESAARNTEKLADVLEDVILRHKGASDQMLRLNRELDTGRKRFGQISADLNRLHDAIEEVTDAEEKAALQNQLNVKSERERQALMRKMYSDTAAILAGGLVKSVLGASKSLVNSYQNNAGAFEMFGGAAEAAIDAQFATGKKLAGMAQGIGAGLSLIPVPKVMAFGAALSTIASISQAVIDNLSEGSKLLLQVGIKELEATQKFFGQVTGAGALFTNGLTEFRNVSARANLTMAEFAKVVQENAEVFSLYGGTVGRGARLFAEASRALDPFRKGLLNLGFSFEEQAEGLARVMEMDALSSTQGTRNSAELARATDSYLTNLKAITAITGEDAKKAQARARDAAMQAAVQTKLRGMDAKAQERFQAATMLLPAELQKGLQQYFVTGAISDPALAAALANNAAAMELFNNAVSMAGDTTLSGTDVTKRFGDDLARLGPDIRKQADAMGQTVGVATLMSGAFAELTKITEALQRLGVKGSKIDEDAVESAEKQKRTTDALTTSFSDAQIAAQQLKIQIQDALTPAITKLAGVIEFGATAITNSITKMLEKMGADSVKRQVEKEQAPIVTPEEQPNAPGPAPTAKVKTTSNLNVAAGVQVGEGLDPALVRVLNDRTLQGKLITSLYRANSETHRAGKAADIAIRGMSADEAARMLINTIASPGVQFAQLETGPGNDKLLKELQMAVQAQGGDPARVTNKGTGPHLHLQTFGKGGITSGASIAGEAGPEAVVPLPDGRTIPVKMDVGELISKMEELIAVTKDHASTSERILYAQS